jgi:hypothetical protein
VALAHLLGVGDEPGLQDIAEDVADPIHAQPGHEQPEHFDVRHPTLYNSGDPLQCPSHLLRVVHIRAGPVGEPIATPQRELLRLREREQPDGLVPMPAPAPSIRPHQVPTHREELHYKIVGIGEQRRLILEHQERINVKRGVFGQNRIKPVVSAPGVIPA